MTSPKVSSNYLLIKQEKNTFASKIRKKFIKFLLNFNLSHSNQLKATASDSILSLSFNFHKKQQTIYSSKENLNFNQEKYLSYLNQFHQASNQHNIIYFNNLILGLIVLLVLFSVLILLEENDSFYNISAISFLLQVTFNLIIIIFSHNLAKQFLNSKSYLR